MRPSSVVIGTMGKGRGTTMYKEMAKKDFRSVYTLFFPIHAATLVRKGDFHE